MWLKEVDKQSYYCWISLPLLHNSFIMTAEYGNFSTALVQLISKPFPFPHRSRDGIGYLNSRLDVGAIGEIKRKVHREKTNYENVPFP